MRGKARTVGAEEVGFAGAKVGSEGGERLPGGA